MSRRAFDISIHTALAGCDIFTPLNHIRFVIFQSTQPSQAVTYAPVYFNEEPGISIHTALAGCDAFSLLMVILIGISIHTALAGCDSKPPSRAEDGQISIHTALAGCDRTFEYKEIVNGHFNPHSPRRL